MEASSGNTLHINNYRRCADSASDTTFYKSKCDIKTAQYILGQTNLSHGANEWRELAQLLYKSAIQSWCNCDDYLISATNTVIDWNSKLNPDYHESFKGFIGMKILLNWQADFVELLKTKKETSKIYFFEYMGNNHAYVIVNSPSTKIMLDYSNIYISFLEENLDVNFEFFIYGKLDNIEVPTHSIIINCEE